MEDVIIFLRPDNCCICGAKGSISLYDEKGVEYNYRQIINSRESDNVLQKFINNTNLTHFRCTKCGEKFTIGWEDSFPVPITQNIKVDNFIEGFKKE